MSLRAEISSRLERKDEIGDPHDEVTIQHHIRSPFLLLCMPRCRLPVESPGISSAQINLGTPSIPAIVFKCYTSDTGQHSSIHASLRIYLRLFLSTSNTHVAQLIRDCVV